MNFLKLLTNIIDNMNTFIKNDTNLEKKKKIYIGLRLDVRLLLKMIVGKHGNG